MVALIIFSIGIVLFYVYSLNAPGEAQESMERLFYDGKIIANTLLSEGYPLDWNTYLDSVQKTGILTDGKIDEDKLEKFYGLTQDNEGYKKTKRLFDTTYEYYFLLDTNMIIDRESVEGIGRSDYENAKNLVKVTRYTVYQNKPMAIYVYAWEEE